MKNTADWLVAGGCCWSCVREKYYWLVLEQNSKTGGNISDSTIRTRQSETWWWTGGGVAVEVAENISYASSLVGSVQDSKQEQLALYVCAGRTRSRRHVNVEGPTTIHSSRRR